MLTPKGKDVLRQINNKYRFPVNRKISSHYYLIGQLLEYEKTGNEEIIEELRRDYSENALIEMWQNAAKQDLIIRAS